MLHAGPRKKLLAYAKQLNSSNSTAPAVQAQDLAHELRAGHVHMPAPHIANGTAARQTQLELQQKRHQMVQSNQLPQQQQDEEMQQKRTTAAHSHLSTQQASKPPAVQLTESRQSELQLVQRLYPLPPSVPTGNLQLIYLCTESAHVYMRTSIKVHHYTAQFAMCRRRL